MSLAEGLRRFKAKSMGRLDTIVRETMLQFGGTLVAEYTPLGDPTLWKAPPPADYRPGNLQSSWFYSVDAPSAETTTRVDIRAMNHIERMPERPAGRLHYFSNSARHAGAIEGGHSSQAPVGIMWAAGEFPTMAEAVTRRVAQ